MREISPFLFYISIYLKEIMKKEHLTRNQIIAEKERLIIENFHRVSKQLGMVTEHGHYDLIGQYKGVHDGNPMGKNVFLNSLGLNENGIETLQILLNLITSDKTWLDNVYPNGYNSNIVIIDILNFFDNNQAAMDYIASSGNPVKYANNLKAAISKKKWVKQ